MTIAELLHANATQRWRVDPASTTVEFEVPAWWGIMTVKGRFKRFDGWYVVDDDGPAIELAIDGSSIDTGIARRDHHLRSDEFFAVEDYPTVRFSSTHVDELGDGRLHVTGELDAAGKSVPVSFEATMQELGDTRQIEAWATIDQNAFGMHRGPLGSIRAPARLHVKAQLVAVSRHGGPPTGSRARAAA